MINYDVRKFPEFYPETPKVFKTFDVF